MAIRDNGHSGFWAFGIMAFGIMSYSDKFYQYELIQKVKPKANSSEQFLKMYIVKLKFQNWDRFIDGLDIAKKYMKSHD